LNSAWRNVNHDNGAMLQAQLESVKTFPEDFFQSEDSKEY